MNIFFATIVKMNISLPIENIIFVNSSYSSALTDDSQSFCRFLTCTQPSFDYYYEAIMINVTVTGQYQITSQSAMDTYGYIYSPMFFPLYPTADVLVQDDELGGDGQFLLVVDLQPMTPYILIVTTSTSNVTGDFIIVVTGPDIVSLSPIIIPGKTLSSFFQFTGCHY